MADHNHVHGPDCGHDHAAHDHAAHDHAGHTMGEYYLEQLLTIGISGAFAAVALLSYASGKLSIILAPELIPWVPAGGVALFALATIRAVVVWRAAGQAGCGHDHGDDGHEHGSIFWRVVVLMFPIVLFLLGLPNQGYSVERMNQMLGADAVLAPVADVAAKEGNDVTMSFADLASAASDAEAREGLQGRTAKLKGQLRKISDRECTLYFMKMNCCAADMIPLKARIIADSSLGAFPDNQWIEVRGTLQFAQVPGKDQYLPVLRASVKNIEKTRPE